MIKRFYLLLLAIVASVGMGWAATMDLSTITSDYEVPDGTTLTGTLGKNVKITIAAGATVTLNGVDINGSGTWTGGDYAGLTCPGNATIILADGTVNRIIGFMDGNAAIHIKPNYTLTIEGDGTLYASTHGGGAAIGCGYSDEGGSRNGGNIVINGGTIYANGGNLAAGIGSGGRATIGNITINGGIIYAVGGGTGAGIGGGQSKSNSWKSRCGNITISSNVKYLKATKGSGAAHSIGKGSSSYSVCGTVTIPGGATGYVSTSPYVYCNPDYVIELINAIPQPVVYTEECKAAIDEARAMYTALTDDQKTSVTNYSTLTDAEAAYAALPVEDKIAAIGTVEYTAESKALIDAARTAYDVLSDEAKAQVSNYATLTAAEEAYAALKLAADQAAADAAIAAINAIPDPVTLKLNTYEKVETARAAYDALTAEQKALVEATTLKRLTDAEAAFAAIDGGGAPTTLIGDGTEQNPYLIGSLEAWNAFVAAVNGGQTNVYAQLTNNISGVTTMAGTSDYPYSGTFDGNGFTMTINISINEDRVGVFRYAKNATIRNLNVEGTITSSGQFVGSIVGEIPNSSSSLTLQNLCSSVAITLSAASDLTSAGIVGIRRGGSLTITDCLFKGSLTATDNGSYCGGIVGYGTSSTVVMTRVIQAGTFNLGSSAYDAVFIRNSDDSFVANDCYYINGVGGATSCDKATQITTSQLNTQTYVDLLQTGKTENYWKLKEGVLVWAGRESAASDPIAEAKAALALINAIPAEIVKTAECKAAIDAARAAVDALGENVSLLEDSDLAKLTNAEAVYASLPKGTWTSGDCEVKIYDDSTMVVSKISGEGNGVMDNYGSWSSVPWQAHRNAVDSLVIEEGVTVLGKYAFYALNIKGALVIPEGVTTLRENTFYGNSKVTSITLPTTITHIAEQYNAFYGCTGVTDVYLPANPLNLTWIDDNDDFIREPAKATLCHVPADCYDAYVAKFAATVNVTFVGDLAVALPEAMRDSINHVKGLIDAIPDPVVYTEDCKAAIDSARAAYNTLSENQKLFIGNYPDLKNAEAAWKVVEKINALPDPLTLTVATKHAIEDVRAAYEALTAEQKALISADELKKLTDAEAAWALLVDGHEDELAAAEAIAELIEAIPQPVVYTDACGNAIAAADTAYSKADSLTRAMIGEPIVQILTDAKIQYPAAGAIEAIEALPDSIYYDEAVRAAVELATSRFDSLSNESKALVPDSLQQKLAEVRAEWAKLVAHIEHNVSYIGKDGELKHEIVKLFHLPDAAPDVNGFEFARWDVKTTELYNEGVKIKAVYSPIITVNPAPYDTLVYNGLAQTLVVAAEAKEGHVEYSFDAQDAQSWQTELPKATNAGVYTIYYKLVREGHDDFIVPDTVYAQIAKAPVTYTAPVAYDSLVYNAQMQTLIVGGYTEDGTFRYSLNPADAESWSADLPQYMHADTLAVAFRIDGDANHLDSIAPYSVQAIIAKAELTATADDKTVIYGDSIPDYTVTYAGWLGADTLDVLFGDIAFNCEYAPTSNVGEYAIAPSGVSAHDYAITFVNGKVSVNQAILTVTADDKTVTYGDAVPEYTVSYSGFLNGDTIDVVSNLQFICEYAPTSNVGEYVIAADSAQALNYAMNYVTGKLTVNKADLTITPIDKTVTYGDSIPEYDVFYTGFLNNDTADVVSNLVLTCAYEPTSNVGEYTITADSAQATNYNISYNTGKLTVEKALMIVVAEDKNVIYGDPVPTYTPAYFGWRNDDSTRVAELISGLQFTCLYAPTSSVGQYIITADSAKAMNYRFEYVAGKVTVNQAALTITANDTVMIYGDAAPEFTASYSGWKNNDNATVVSGLKFTTPYNPGSHIGTYDIVPSDATAENYAISFVNGKLTVNKAVVYVSDAEAQIAKFADGHAGAEVLKAGTLNGIKLNDAVTHITTAAFSSAEVSEHLTITLFYELSGNATLLNDYLLTPTEEVFTTEGVIIEPFIPDTTRTEEHDEDQTEVQEGISVYAYGYCEGDNVGLKYHLNSGNPDQYKIEFEDSRFTDVNWTNLDIAGKDGVIYIDIPVDVPTGDYQMTVYFRDSRFVWLESQKLNVTFHVNLPETYVQPLFGNTIVLIDTCECFTDIQWYYRANSSDPWQPIPGATGHYYHAQGNLTGEYFVSAKMNGVPTYTCEQVDMNTLYGAETKQAKVQAYPNPVVTTTTVSIENSDKDEHNLRIVNLMGIEVENTTFEGNETVVDMDSYTTGNYTISVDGIVVKVLKK